MGALVRLWRLLDAAPQGRRVPGTVPVFALGVLVSAGASVWSVRSGWNFAYTDAMAHLTIARRVIDSPNAGPAQLGTVWLPFPHLLLLPLVQSLWLWRTGIAASIVGALCMGSACASLHRILARVGVDGIGRALALVIMLANPSLVYVSTTALTEPVLIACLLACIAGLVGWATSPRVLSGGELAVFAGLPAAAGVLTRYEGWALTVTGTIYVFLAARARGLGWRRRFVAMACFVGPAVLAVAAWVSYNWAMYGNPLDFMNGPYSAAQFNVGFRFQGVMQAQGNLGLTFEGFFEGLFEIAGAFPLALAIAGLVVMLLRWSVLDVRALTVWLAATSTAFLLFSLYTGQHLVMNDASIPKGDFNNRQTLSAMPWIAMLCALLVGLPWLRRRWRAAAIVAALVGVVWQNVWWSHDYYHRNTVLAEGANGISAESDRTAVSVWVGHHYDGGGLLVDETSIASMPQIGLPLRDYYLRSNGASFDDALADPTRYVRWILMHRVQERYDGDTHDDDMVTAAMRQLPQFVAQYTLVHTDGPYAVYRRIGAPQ